VRPKNSSDWPLRSMQQAELGVPPEWRERMLERVDGPFGRLADPAGFSRESAEMVARFAQDTLVRIIGAREATKAGEHDDADVILNDLEADVAHYLRHADTRRRSSAT
jgi:hypothetical protein